MTEDEAKSKWCPMVRMGEANSTDNRNCAFGVINKDPGMGIQWNCCIASACMMFRETFCQSCATMGAVEKHGCNNKHYYCGLAGTP